MDEVFKDELTPIQGLGSYCPPDAELLKKGDRAKAEDRLNIRLMAKLQVLCQIAKMDAWHDHHSIPTGNKIIGADGKEKDEKIDPIKIDVFVNAHLPKGLNCYKDTAAASAVSPGTPAGTGQPSTEDNFMFRTFLKEDLRSNKDYYPKCKPNCDEGHIPTGYGDDFFDKMITERYDVGKINFKTDEDKPENVCTPGGGEDIYHAKDTDYSVVQDFFVDQDIDEDIHIIRDVAYGNWGDDIAKWGKGKYSDNPSKIITVQTANGIFDPGPSTSFFTEAGQRCGFTDIESKSRYGLFESYDDTNVNLNQNETVSRYDKLDPDGGDDDDDGIDAWDRNQVLCTRFDCVLYGHTIKLDPIDDDIYNKKTAKKFIGSANVNFVVKDGENVYIATEKNSNRAQTISELPDTNLPIKLTAKEQGSYDKRIFKTTKLEQIIRDSGKLRIMTKKFGDHGQAVTTTREKIEYRLFEPIENDTENVKITREISNGIHAFLSFDRIAVSAALYYGAPIVIYTNKYGAIIFISKQLIDIVAKPTNRYKSFTENLRKKKITYDNLIKKYNKKIADNTPENAGEVTMQGIINNTITKTKVILTDIIAYINEIVVYLKSDSAFEKFNLQTSDIIYKGLLHLLESTSHFIKSFVSVGNPIVTPKSEINANFDAWNDKLTIWESEFAEWDKIEEVSETSGATASAAETSGATASAAETSGATEIAGTKKYTAAELQKLKKFSQIKNLAQSHKIPIFRQSRDDLVTKLLLLTTENKIEESPIVQEPPIVQESKTQQAINKLDKVNNSDQLNEINKINKINNDIDHQISKFVLIQNIHTALKNIQDHINTDRSKKKFQKLQDLLKVSDDTKDIINSCNPYDGSQSTRKDWKKVLTSLHGTPINGIEFAFPQLVEIFSSMEDYDDINLKKIFSEIFNTIYRKSTTDDIYGRPLKLHIDVAVKSHKIAGNDVEQNKNKWIVDKLFDENTFTDNIVEVHGGKKKKSRKSKRMYKRKLNRRTRRKKKGGATGTMVLPAQQMKEFGPTGDPTTPMAFVKDFFEQDNIKESYTINGAIQKRIIDHLIEKIDHNYGITNSVSEMKQNIIKWVDFPKSLLTPMQKPEIKDSTSLISKTIESKLSVFDIYINTIQTLKQKINYNKAVLNINKRLKTPKQQFNYTRAKSILYQCNYALDFIKNLILINLPEQEIGQTGGETPLGRLMGKKFHDLYTLENLANLTKIDKELLTKIHKDNALTINIKDFITNLSNEYDAQIQDRTGPFKPGKNDDNIIIEEDETYKLDFGNGDKGYKLSEETLELLMKTLYPTMSYTLNIVHNHIADLYDKQHNNLKELIQRNEELTEGTKNEDLANSIKAAIAKYDTPIIKSNPNVLFDTIITDISIDNTIKNLLETRYDEETKILNNQEGQTMISNIIAAKYKPTDIPNIPWRIMTKIKRTTSIEEYEEILNEVEDN
jgi:hypothetical protein